MKPIIKKLNDMKEALESMSSEEVTELFNEHRDGNFGDYSALENHIIAITEREKAEIGLFLDKIRAYYHPDSLVISFLMRDKNGDPYRQEYKSDEDETNVLSKEMLGILKRFSDKCKSVEFKDDSLNVAGTSIKVGTHMREVYYTIEKLINH